MNFNHDPGKQAQKVIFSRKLQKENHNQVYFNHNSVKQVSSQKHIGIYLNAKLNFQEHVNNIISKVNKTIRLWRKLQAFLPHQSLVTVYKAFITPHLDHGDLIYDQTYDESFHQKMELLQYNAALAITGAIRRTSREKLYQELGLESLHKNRWCINLCYFFKIFKVQSPECLFRIIPSVSKAYNTRANDKIPLFSCKQNLFINSFFYQLSSNGIA